MNRRKTQVMTVSAVLVVSAVGIYSVIMQKKVDLNNVNDVITQARRHVVIDSKEMPALVTVEDPTKVTTPFLKNTQVGDKVLIYQTDRRAIIYRPSIDKVVDIGTVIIETPQTNREK